MEAYTLQYAKPWFLFWTTVILAHVYMDYSLYRKWRGWSRGIRNPSAKGRKWGRIARIWLAEVFFQRQLFGLSSFRWLFHVLICWGFIALAFLSLSTFIMGLITGLGMDGGWFRYLLRGEGRIFLKIWGESFGLALLVGLAAASARRLFFRPDDSTKSGTDMFLLFFLLWLTLSGFALEGLRLAFSADDVATYSFIGRLFTPSGNYTSEQLRPYLTVLWSLHSFSGVALLFYLPHSKLLHGILAPLIIALNAIEEHERKDIYWPHIRKNRATGSHGG